MDKHEHEGILAHQRPAYEKLLAVANACFYSQRHTLPLRLRTNTLLIGASGSGKTYLAKTVARHLGVPIFSIAISDWILLGCSQRGALPTWPNIVRFLQKNNGRDGVVIFFDEVDKLCGGSSWERFLRTEVFKLLDLEIPEGLCGSDEEPLSAAIMSVAAEVLAKRTLIVAAGAFQEIWEKRTKPTIGFVQKPFSQSVVSIDVLSKYIPRELANRFRADVLMLPPLVPDDYRRMIDQIAAQVPAYLRKTFSRLAAEQLERAIACKQGCRFLEEVLLETLIVERTHITEWKNMKLLTEEVLRKVVVQPPKDADP